MPTQISKLADVDPRAEIDDDVFIGPFCSVGPNVQLGSGSRLESHVAMFGHVRIGKNNRFFPGSVIGGDPQDLGYTGAPTRVEIGDDNVFREGVTVNRGAEKEDGITRVDNNNMFMANSHVAHNCHIFNHVIIANGTQLGGHVHVHDRAVISGNSLVHHFATIGTMAFVSGGCGVRTDVPPYMLTAGMDRCRVMTINLVGMQRGGIDRAAIEVIKRAHRLLYRELKGLADARRILSEELRGPFPAELTLLLDFIEQQQSGKKGRAGEARRDPAKAAAPENNTLRRAA